MHYEDEYTIVSVTDTLRWLPTGWLWALLLGGGW
jgi:hypothetical protein